MSTISAEEYRKLLSKSRKGQARYRRAPAEERTFEGITFDSKAEMHRYMELRAGQRAKKIRWIIIHPKFPLAGVIYTADFAYAKVWEPYVDGAFQLVVEEVKPAIKNARARNEALRPWRRNARQVKEIHKIDLVLIER